VAEVIAAQGDGLTLRGSGYRVAHGAVLTAAHVVAAASSIKLRFNADRPGEFVVDGRVVWSDLHLDVAVVRLAEALGESSDFAALEYGQIGLHDRTLTCSAVGFPRFKLRRDRTGMVPVQYRDSHHAFGTAAPLSNLREGTLEIRVHPPERDPVPDHSPWEGMSGAAVWSGSCLIGIITQHHRSDGLGTLSASRIDSWYELLAPEDLNVLATLIALPANAAALADVAVPAATVARPASIPRDAANFTNRTRELDLLLNAGSWVFSINGMPGVGKTTFAVHVAHRLAHRFPDGQIFLPLHAHTPGLQRPVLPDDALGTLLLTVGLLPQQIPQDVEARIGLWRSYVADKRFLLLLDDAEGSEQIRPLLPGTHDSLVMVTSRRRLTSLEEAVPISLDILSPEEASELFVRTAARSELTADDPIVAGAISLCGYLPLAIRLAASQLRHHPTWAIEDLVDELGSSSNAAIVLHAEGVSIAATFDLSYRDLTSEQQRMFRWIGSHPGMDIDAYAAAALGGIGLAQARNILTILEDHHLIEEPVRGRYAMHDLVRDHVRMLAMADTEGYSAAVGRWLEQQLGTALAAVRRLGYDISVTGPPALPVLDFSTPTHALDWLNAERANLHAAVNYAANQGRLDYAMQLPAVIHYFLLTQGHWDQAISLHETAVKAARQLSDLFGEANALSDLGAIQYLTGRYAATIETQSKAAELHRRIGNQEGQARALASLGAAQHVIGNHEAAVGSLGTSLNLYRGTLSLLGQANVLNELADVHQSASRYPDAVDCFQRALELYRQTDQANGEANAATGLADVQYMMGEYLAAEENLRRGLELHRQLGNRLGQANVFVNWGTLHARLGLHAQAVDDQRRALDLYREIGHLHGQAYALTELGSLYGISQDHASGLESIQSALELFIGIGSPGGEAYALAALGSVQTGAQNYLDARVSLDRALDINRDIGSLGGEADALTHLGRLVFLTGSAAESRGYFAEALRISDEISSPFQKAAALEGIGLSHMTEGESIAHLRLAGEIYASLGVPDSSRVQAVLDGLGF
jgi:tetratricopeptide (TPR) repeat protein